MSVCVYSPFSGLPPSLLYLWFQLSLLWSYTLCVCLLPHLVAASLYLHTSRGEHPPPLLNFRPPNTDHKHTDSWLLGDPKRCNDKILKMVIHFYLTSAFYTSRAELVIPMQICLSPYMDTHIHMHTVNSQACTCIHIHTYIELGAYNSVTLLVYKPSLYWLICQKY